MNGIRRFCLGLAYLLVVVAVATLAVVLNKDTFQHNTPIEVVGDRAGLTLAAGARVKFRGVDVGRVTSIDPVSAGARVHVALFNDQVHFVPADVTAHVVPPTAFGAKYVDLVAPADESTGERRPIAAGARVTATEVTTEYNDAFENLTKLMHVARPDRVNNALTASAQILDGRGAEAGRLVTGLEQYLGELDSSLPELSRDVKATGPALDVYDQSADDLVTVLDNAGVASRTLSARESSLDALLTTATRFSNRTGQFLDTNQPGIARVVNVFDPVTALLARYAPELPCTLAGVVDLNSFVEKAFGGKRPGYYTESRFRPGGTPYRPDVNLPIVREDRGPRCYQLPAGDVGRTPSVMPVFDTGANPSSPEPPSDQLAATFFGALDGLVSGP